MSSAEGGPNISDSISGIYSAINLEKRVNSIEGEMQKKYSELLSQKLGGTEKNQQEYLKHFSAAKSTSLRSSRSRRSTVPSAALSKDQRTALWKIYSLYNSLKDASKDLALRFRENVPSINMPVALAHSAVDSTKNIEKSLETIEWSGDSIKTQKNRSSSSQFYRANSWGNWDDNPFKPFYKGWEEFRQDIQSLQKNASTVAWQEQDLARTRARASDIHSRSRVWSTLQKQFTDLENRIASLKASQDSHIVQKVADYLLKSMGQLS